MMQAVPVQTVKIADRTYAVGLWWQTVSEDLSSKKVMLKLARDTAADPDLASYGYNQVAFCPQQYGLGHWADPSTWPPKTVSLAAAFRPATGKKEAFIGVFCLAADLWWVCGRLRGSITAEGGDEIFKTKEEALVLASSQRQLLEEIVEIEEVIHDSPEASHGYLKPRLIPGTPLRPLYDTEGQERLLRRGLAVAAVVLALGGMLWGYGEYQARREASHQAWLGASREAQRREQLAHPERFFQKAWLKAPDFSGAGKQCLEAVLKLPVSVNAWRLEEAVCRPGSGLQITWAHRKGAPFVALPAGASLVSEQEAVETRSLSPLPVRPASARPLLTKEEATAVMYQLTQNLRSHLSLSWEAPEQYRIDDETVVTAPWQRGAFELSQLPAQAFLGTDLFGALGHPGALLVSLTRKNNHLTIKGYFHASSK